MSSALLLIDISCLLRRQACLGCSQSASISINHPRAWISATVTTCCCINGKIKLNKCGCKIHTMQLNDASYHQSITYVSFFVTSLFDTDGPITRSIMKYPVFTSVSEAIQWLYSLLIFNWLYVARYWLRSCSMSKFSLQTDTCSSAKRSEYWCPEPLVANACWWGSRLRLVCRLYPSN